jgi:hypothetical protein
MNRPISASVRAPSFGALSPESEQARRESALEIARAASARTAGSALLDFAIF